MTDAPLDEATGGTATPPGQSKTKPSEQTKPTSQPSSIDQAEAGLLTDDASSLEPRRDPSEVTRRLEAERSFLTMTAGQAPVSTGLFDGSDEDDSSAPTSMVLSWLVDRQMTGGSMTVLSPLLVVLTIWDAASSAGAGLAAPASGLGTFVLLILLDRSRLAKRDALPLTGDAD